MRFLELIYFSQYYELKKSGRDPQKGRINGTLLSAVIIILNLASVIMLLFRYAPNTLLINWLDHEFGDYRGSGKALGQLTGAILIITIGGLLWITAGSKKSYNKIAEKYQQLPDEVQHRTIRQALMIFLISFVLFLLLIFVL